MKAFHSILALVAILSLGDLASASASTDLESIPAQAFDVEIERTILEFDAMLEETAEDPNAALTPSKREARVQKRLDRRFDRQFKRFARRIDKALKRHSDEELREVFTTHEIRHGALVGASLESSEAYSIAINEEGGFVGIRAALQGLTSNEYREELRAKLHSEIAAAGGSIAYLKANRKALSVLRTINGCAWKDAALRYVIPAIAVSSFWYLGLDFGLSVMTLGAVQLTPVAIPLNFLVDLVGMGASLGIVLSGQDRNFAPENRCTFVRKTLQSELLGTE